MKKIRRDYPDIAPSGPTYRRGVHTGNLQFIAGSTARGTDSWGKPLMEQLRVTLDRITRIGAAKWGSPGDIVKITTYVTSINDWRASALERQSLFTEYFKGEYPANTLVEITALAEPEDRIGQR